MVLPAAELRIEADPEDVGMDRKRLGSLARVLRGHVDEGRYPGVLSLVARRGKVVHLDTYGSMDVERGRALRPDTIFRIYSMSKPVASVALMSLYEEGRFQLDDPVSAFIPEFAGLQVFAGGDADGYQVRDPARPMTVRDLLTHTSGLTSAGTSTAVGELYARAGLKGSRSEGTLAEMAQRVARVPLLTDPGARFNYGISTDLVGYLCEVISGLPLDRFLEERIFGPLGMADTGFSVPPSKTERFAANYESRAGTPAYGLFDDPATSLYSSPRSYFSAAGGLVSTAGDYLRFAGMLAGGGELDGVRVLGPRTLRLMTSNHLPGGRDLPAMTEPGQVGHDLVGRGFGLGFAVVLDRGQAQTAGAAGEYFWDGAASTSFYVNPAEDLIVVFMTQLLPSDEHPVDYPTRNQLRTTVYSSITD
jgi:CubicO group peptidase (beta-lactamase class C family)